MSLFMSYIISICIAVLCTCTVICLWWALSKGRHITRDIIENVNETIVIFDRHDKPCYVNLTNNNQTDESEFLQSIEQKINQSGCIPKDLNNRCLEEKEPILFEGEMKPYLHSDSVFSWKMCPIVRNRQYHGRIYVFNDITQYAKLQEQLNNQNRQLKEALEAQRKYTEITQKLSTEEERERIMVIIDRVAKEYLEQLNDSIERMEVNSHQDSDENLAVYEAENEKMIQLTRDTIGKVRSTVKELHVTT